MSTTMYLASKELPVTKQYNKLLEKQASTFQQLSILLETTYCTSEVCEDSYNACHGNNLNWHHFIKPHKLHMQRSEICQLFGECLY